MQLKSKQRAFLKKEAHSLTPIMRIGKDGISDNVIESILLAIDSRELIKIKLLQNVTGDKRELAKEIELKSGCQLVDVIGSILILYKEKEEKPVYKERLKRL